jgi:hypothetical protein
MANFSELVLIKVSKDHLVLHVFMLDQLYASFFDYCSADYLNDAVEFFAFYINHLLIVFLNAIVDHKE